MTAEMKSSLIPTEPLDLRQIVYFSVVAEECNLHRAAARLCLSQPPLSRQIKQFEERLGLTLFVRHTRGLTLTSDGHRILELIQPLLHQEAHTRQELAALQQRAGKRVTVGLTTAFEQGVFAQAEVVLRERFGARLCIERATSPRLMQKLRRGKLMLAFVALPVETRGLEVRSMPYAEPQVVALPAQWSEAGKEKLSLIDLNGRPLFWFRREANPAFFDFMRCVFAHVGFAPQYIEEPLEHDVLLARIAAGEGFGLFPASFAAIRREGVTFVPISEGMLLEVHLGCALAADVPSDNEAVGMLHSTMELFIHEMTFGRTGQTSAAVRCRHLFSKRKREP